MAATKPFEMWKVENVKFDMDPNIISFHLMDDSDYLECITFVLHLDDHSIVFIQVMVSNVGIYKHTPGINFKHILADGKTHVAWQQKWGASDIELLDGGASIKLGDKTTMYDAANRVYTAHYPMTGGNDVGEFHMVLSPTSEPFSMGDGTLYYGADRKVMTNVFPHPRGSLSGHYFYKGTRFELTGVGFSSHLVQNLKAHHVATTWHLLKFNSPEASINFTSFRVPADYGGEYANQGSFIHNGKIVCITTDLEMELHEPTYDPDTKYSPCKSSTLRWKGTTRDGKPFSAVAECPHRNLIDKMDVLAAIPWVLRMIIRAFIARPYIYRYHDEMKVTVTVGDETMEFTGWGLRETTFVNPE